MDEVMEGHRQKKKQQASVDKSRKRRGVEKRGREGKRTEQEIRRRKVKQKSSYSNAVQSPK